MAARAPLSVGLLLLVTGVMATPAVAEPIARVDHVLVGDGFILHGGVTLSAEQLGLLASLDDQGWHLGWFKRKLREAADPGSTTVLPSFVETALSPHTLVLPNIVVDPTLGPVASFLEPSFTAGTVAQVTPVSEPASLVLLASGLIGFSVFRRWRDRRNS